LTNLPASRARWFLHQEDAAHGGNETGLISHFVPCVVQTALELCRHGLLFAIPPTQRGALRFGLKPESLTEVLYD
jgi:hypothetical protein